MAKEDRLLKVAEFLVEKEGSWVPGYEIASKQVGGSEGLKRLRELRLRGWPIEKQKMNGSAAYQYRLPRNWKQ